MPTRLQTISEEVHSLIDEQKRPIDEHIKAIVIALRYYGFHTSASCQGHMDHGLPYPWVEISANRSGMKHLRKLLKVFYEQHQSVHPLLIQNNGGFRLQSVRLKWRRHFLQREVINPAPNQQLLESYQKEMDAFARYLILNSIET